MKPTVSERYVSFTTKFEGKLPFMYLDVKGLVTTGIGNLVDPVESAYTLPWNTSSGTRATSSQIRAAWNAVKARQDLKLKGGVIFGGLTTLRLDESGIQEVVKRKLLENEDIIRRHFRSYDDWPADAQLGVLSMAWAAGANIFAKFPKFSAAANTLLPDFWTMAQECHLEDQNNPGLTPRNVENVKLFQNAACVLEYGLDPDRLYWPLDIMTQGVQQAVAAVSEATESAGEYVYANPKKSTGLLFFGGIALAAILYKKYGV